MLWQSNLYAIPLLVGAALLIIFALLAWRRDSTLAVTVFFVYALFNAGLMIAYAMELLAANLQIMLFWVKIQHIFFCIPVIWLLFLMIYTGAKRWLRPSIIGLLFLIPVIQALAAWSNDFHHLYWLNAQAINSGGVWVLSLDYGPLFIIGMTYLYLITIIAIIFTIYTVLLHPITYRGQIVLLLSGALLPVLSNLLTLSGLTNVLHFDLTPFGFALVCAPVGWNLFRQNLFDIIPAAYGKIVQSMNDAIFVLNPEHVIVTLNPAAEHLSHLPVVEASGKNIADVLPQVQSLLQSDERLDDTQHDLLMVDDNRSFDLRISRITTRSGKLTGRVIVLRDVTERIEDEEIIRKYAEELESRNSELGAFNHTIAHDLKAPIGIILGYIHILRNHENIPPDQAAKYLQKIEASARNMENMVSGLLMLAQLHNISDMMTSVNMVETAQTAAERFQAEIQERGIQIDIAQNMPPAAGHEVWITEVFANLIGNAIKYIGKDNPEPCIRVYSDQNHDSTRYIVQDNGIGIALENQDSLFEMFTRFHTEEAGGAGLGLSITRRIVGRLNGEMGVISAPDAGSSFWFTLPNAEKS